MPYRILDQQPRIQKSILEKLDTASFATIQASCSSIFNFSNENLNKRILEQKRQTIRIENGELGISGFSRGPVMDYRNSAYKIHSNEWVFICDLSDQVCEEAIEYLTRTGSTVKEIFVSAFFDIQCSAEFFNQLIKITGATSFHYKRNMPVELLQTERIRKLECCIGICDSLMDDDVHLMEAPKIDFQHTLTTSEGINLIIKQWMDGTRISSYISLTSTWDFNEDEVLEGFEPVVDPSFDRQWLLTNRWNAVLIVHITHNMAFLRLRD